MRMRAFQHVLSLDQAYFDNHSASAIRGSMNAHSINNLITWNIPYLVTLNLQFFMTAIYMLRIGKFIFIISISNLIFFPIYFCFCLIPNSKIRLSSWWISHFGIYIDQIWFIETL